MGVRTKIKAVYEQNMNISAVFQLKFQTKSTSCVSSTFPTQPVVLQLARYMGIETLSDTSFRVLLPLLQLARYMGIETYFDIS